jgi:plastocyanin domain-containing protein
MKNTWMIAAIVIIVLVFGAIFIRGSDNLTTGKAILSNALSNNGQVQVVKLSVVNGKYVMSPSEFKVGVPVRIEADMANMPGCSKTIVIPSFNVRKSFTSTDNTVEFTPDKAGTFNIMCSMNMYQGTFTVLGNDGTKANYVEQAPASSSGSTCGMAKSGSGGCGCGG